MNVVATLLVLVNKITAGVLLVRLVPAALASAVLIAIAVQRKRRSEQALLESENSSEGHEAITEPTEAQVEAAEESIRMKTNAAVQQSKAKAKISLLRLAMVSGASIPFLYGMPLHSYFRPVGQIFLFFSVVAVFGALIDGWGLWVAWSFRRSMEKLLEL